MGSVGINAETGVGIGMGGAKPDLKGNDGEVYSTIPVPDCHVPLNEQTDLHYPRLLAPSPLDSTSRSRLTAASGQLSAEHTSGAGTGAIVGAVVGAGAVLSVLSVETGGALHRESGESTYSKEEGVLDTRESPHNCDPEIITCRDNMLRREKHEIEAKRIETTQSKGILESSPVLPSPQESVRPPGNGNSSNSNSSNSNSSSNSSSSSRVPLGAVRHFKKRGSMSPLQRCCDILCMVWPLVLVLSVGPGGGVGAGPIDLRGDDGGLDRASVGNMALQSGADNVNKSQLMSSTSSSSSTSRHPADPTGPVSGPTPPPQCRIRVTDGWWWCDAALDCELSKLLEKVLVLTRNFYLD
jgi:hypothetical protein